MKVAVSIPDDVFAEAEALAKRLKSSRSEFYSRALGEFIGLHAPDRVTELMNDVVRDVSPVLDAFSVVAGRQSLGIDDSPCQRAQGSVLLSAAATRGSPESAST
jgi:hypothetical protein